MRFSIFIPATVLLLLLSACGDSSAPSATPIPPTATAAPDPYIARLSDAVLQRVEAASWYKGGDYDSAGANVLDVITSGGPLWRDEQSLQLLEAYPQGIPDETLATAKTYARVTLNDIHDVILESWLVDGIDDYERAVLAEANRRTISVAALRRALAEGFFRQTYETDPAQLTSERIDAVGSLSPQVLRIWSRRTGSTMASIPLKPVSLASSTAFSPSTSRPRFSTAATTARCR